MIIGLILGSFDDVWMEDELLWFLEEDEGEREEKNLLWFLEEDEDESKEEKKCILLHLQFKCTFVFWWYLSVTWLMCLGCEQKIH